MKNQLLIFLLSLLFISCKREEINPSSKDYLIFGRFISECAGIGSTREICIEIFKLEKDQLFEDTNDNYPNRSEIYKGNFIKVSQQKFDDAKHLLNIFPRDLWKESKKVIGNPDDRDQGGLYIEFKHNGKRRYWLIDNSKDSVPPKYHKFIDKVRATIDAIQ